jgi:hypothetical protein
MTQGVQEALMTAILAEFAPYVTPPSVLAVSSDYTLINIFAVVVIAAMGVGCAIALKKPLKKS